MRSSLLFAVVIASGSLAGLAYGAANLVLVEPLLDEAIGLENEALFESGAEADTPEFALQHEQYRAWQKSGQALASVVLGASFGSLFGIVYWYAQPSLPGSHPIAKALCLAGIMWLVIFFIPFLKYPSGLPGTGDPDTVGQRSALYAAFAAMSAMSALGLYYASRLMPGRYRHMAIAGYAALVACMFAALPAAPPDPVSGQLLLDFRAASAASVSIFWAAAGLLLGAMWSRYGQAQSKSME